MFKALVAGGGTAGHIEPALAVADALRERGATVEALGTRRGLETDLVPERGYRLHLIDPVPVPRKLNLDLVRLPGRVAGAVGQARSILGKGGFDAVIGFGGYVAAPAYLAAWSLRLPFYVHEANARAGIANKLGVRLGGTGFNAAENSGMPGEVVGIPVRKNLSGRGDDTAAARGREQFGLAAETPTVLVTGGSQGAVHLNEAVADGLGEVLGAGIQVLHAYGKKNPRPEAADRDGYTAVPYITDMQAAYAVADLVVCRSGALTVAEVSAAGLPAVYVPLPHGNGEQGLNAAAAVRSGAARLIEDAALTGRVFAEQVTGILGDADRLARMRAAAHAAGKSGAADHVAERVLSDAAARSNQAGAGNAARKDGK